MTRDGWNVIKGFDDLPEMFENVIVIGSIDGRFRELIARRFFGSTSFAGKWLSEWQWFSEIDRNVTCVSRWKPISKDPLRFPTMDELDDARRTKEV